MLEVSRYIAKYGKEKKTIVTFKNKFNKSKEINVYLVPSNMQATAGIRIVLLFYYPYLVEKYKQFKREKDTNSTTPKDPFFSAYTLPAFAVYVMFTHAVTEQVDHALNARRIDGIVH